MKTTERRSSGSTSETRTRYAVMRVLSWDSIGVQGVPFTASAAAELGAGFMMVFDGMDELRRHHPTAEVLELEVVTAPTG